jgi:putative solute:sodium symporter small subunit
MIEIGLGALLVAAALAVLLPGITGIDLALLLGYTGVGILLAAGVLMIAAGLARRAIARSPQHRYARRSARLAIGGTLVTAIVAIGLPLAAGPANLVQVGGMPAGYYLAAQAAPIGLVLLAFVWAMRQNRIDAEEHSDE